jgi:uncharacterized membrane protein
MTQRTTIAATAAAVLSLLAASAPAMAQEKEKCSCAGQSKVDLDKTEWKYVVKGTCKDLKGLTLDEAKKAKG